jgi:hypothetical protein
MEVEQQAKQDPSSYGDVKPITKVAGVSLVNKEHQGSSGCSLSVASPNASFVKWYINT